jgi:CHAP domain
MAGALDVLNVARQQLGFVEGPNNENPYGSWYGIPNESYCAMGISWCFAQVGLSALVAAQTDKGFAYCPAGLAWFQKKKQVVDRNAAKAGDIVFFSWAGNGVADHVELVEGASTLGLTTIGFNTGPDFTTKNQQNGDGVYRRQRNFLHVLAIVRPDYPTVVKPTTSYGTNSKIGAGVAGAGVLGTGGLAAVTHGSTPASNTPPTPATTVFVAPPFPKSGISLGTQSKAVKAVEMALKKAGLIPNEQGVYNANDQAGVIAWQKKHKLKSKSLDQATYDSLIASL